MTDHGADSRLLSTSEYGTRQAPNLAGRFGKEVGMLRMKPIRGDDIERAVKLLIAIAVLLNAIARLLHR